MTLLRNINKHYVIKKTVLMFFFEELKVTDTKSGLRLNYSRMIL